jgi:hypothetical protein
MSRLFLDPLRAGLLGRLCSISPALWAASLWHPQAPDMLPQAAGALVLDEQSSPQRFALATQAPSAVAPAMAPSSDFGDALKNATRDAAQ